MRNINIDKLLKPVLFVVAGIALVSIVYYFVSEKSIKDYDDIVALGRIKVLTDNSALGFRVDGDSVYGFQYEIVKAFATKMGVELEISESDDSDESLKNLIAGDFDIVASLLPVTTELRRQVLFTNPLQVNRQLLVQRNDSVLKINKQYELAGDTICIPQNSPYISTINHLSDDIADTIYVSELKNTTPEVAVKMVAQGIIRFTICTERVSAKMLQEYPQLDISLPIGFQQESAWAVNKKALLLQKKLNEFLSDFIGSSQYWDIYRKYY